MAKQVAFVGAGLMGSGMIRNLVQRDYRVKAYDVSAQALKRVEELGAMPVTTLQEALAGNDHVLLSLPEPPQVREAVQEIVREHDNADGNEMMIIDFSTIDSGTAKDMANLTSISGIRYLEAPVSGGPKGADSGTLSIMVGGDQDTFLHVKPLLEVLGSNIYYLGDTGNASLVKLCNNAVVAAITAILGEAFVLAASEGISPDQLASVLSTSVGGSKTLEIFGHHMVSGDYSKPTFSLSLMHKDLGLFMETARQNGVASLLGGLTYQLYEAAYSKGWSKEDQSVVCRFLEEFVNQKPETVRQT